MSHLLILGRQLRRGGNASAVFQPYSTYARGLDPIRAAYQLLDLVPKGRDEGPGFAMSWVRRHDQYAGPVRDSAAFQTTAQTLPGGHDMMLDVAWEQVATAVHAAIVKSAIPPLLGLREPQANST